MKRILTLMFTAVLLFSLTACAQKPLVRAEVCRRGRPTADAMPDRRPVE